MDRREFIKTTSVTSFGAMLFPGCVIKEKDPTYHFFTEAEAETIIAFSEQLIPADEIYGGATDACVVYYIDRQLNGTFKKHAKSYRDNIKKLNDYCQLKYDNSFAKLSEAKQIEVMQMMEKNRLDKSIWKTPAIFFKTVHSHTKQGFYGSAVHGGNKNHISFNMMGVDGMLQIRLEDPVAYQALNNSN